MLKIKISILIILISLSVSCVDDNEVDRFTEKWSLIRITQGFAKPVHFETNEITWEFINDSILSVQVSDKVTLQTLSPLSEGDYNYGYLGSERIQINGQLYFYFKENDTLLISQDVVSDGPEFTFKR